MEYDIFDIPSQELILKAQKIAQKQNHRVVDIAHILSAILENQRDVIKKLVDQDSFQDLRKLVFDSLPARNRTEIEKQSLSKLANSALNHANNLKKGLGFDTITSILIVAGIVREQRHEISIKLKQDYGITPLSCVKSIES